jgi:hypothetical protein
MLPGESQISETFFVKYPEFLAIDLGSIPGATEIFWEVVGLEQGPLSLVSTIEELLERKSRGSGLGTENAAVGICCTDHATPTICKSWH